MKKIICPKTGYKLAQMPDCKCDKFTLFLNKANEIVAECTKCGTVYSLDSLKKANS